MDRFELGMCNHELHGNAERQIRRELFASRKQQPPSADVLLKRIAMSKRFEPEPWLPASDGCVTMANGATSADWPPRSERIASFT